MRQLWGAPLKMGGVEGTNTRAQPCWADCSAAERPPCPADGSADRVRPPVPRASRPPCALTPDAPGPPPSTRAAPFRGTGTASGGKCRRGHRLLTRKATSQLEDRRDSQHVRNTPPRRRRPRSSTDAEHAPPPRPRDAAEARVPVTRASAPGTCRRGQQSCSAATTAHALPGEGRATASTACNRHTINNNRFLRSGLASRSPASAGGGGGAGSVWLGALPGPFPGLLLGLPLRLTHPQGLQRPQSASRHPPRHSSAGAHSPPPGLPEQINK